MLANKEEIFIKENLGLVHSCCRRFIGRNIEYDDMFQAGCMGLLKASRDFDESRGFMFSTYAVPVILGEIKRLFRDTGAVKVSRALKDLSLKVAHTQEHFEKQNGRSPTAAELAELLEVSADDINEALNVARPVASLTYSDEEKVCEMDIPVVDEEETISNRLVISQALSALSEKDRKIIVYRYFRGYTQNQIADMLCMTQVQVSRREKKLIEEMRSVLM